MLHGPCRTRFRLSFSGSAGQAHVAISLGAPILRQQLRVAMEGRVRWITLIARPHQGDLERRIRVMRQETNVVVA